MLTGERATRPVSISGFVSGEVPADGFIISYDGPGSVPLFVRDEDIEKAKRVRNEKEKSVSIDAVSWGSE